MIRYFALVNNYDVSLSNEDIHHLLHVMRKTIGDQFEVVNNNKLFLCEITSLNPFKCLVKNMKEEHSELDYDVTPLLPLLKSEKMELVLQKASELGVKRIVLVNCERCNVKIDEQTFTKKRIRYQKICEEACEQSRRLTIPIIDGIFDLKSLPNKYLSTINLVAYERLVGDNNMFPMDKKVNDITYLIGPEGGFSEKEIDLLIKKGFECISLGKRILRVETAAIAGLSLISYWLERK